MLPSLYVVPEVTCEVRLRALEGVLVSSKSQGSATESREFSEGVKVNSVAQRGFALRANPSCQINDFSPEG